MLRLFVGLTLPPDIKLRLSLLCAGVPGARWVDPGNFHVTVRYIGEIDEGLASDVDAAFLKLRLPRFEMTLSGTGIFGPPEKPRQVWAGLARNDALLRLHDKIEATLLRLGVPPEERRYVPHVTLARLPYPPALNLEKLGEFLAATALFRAGPIKVDQFSLIASYLTKSGPIYEDQADYSLTS